MKKFIACAVAIYSCGGLFSQDNKIEAPLPRKSTKAKMATSPKKDIDAIRKDVFMDTYKATKTIKANISVGVDVKEFGELIRKFAVAIEMLPKPKNSKEEDLIKQYGDIIAIYKDSLDIWESRISSTSSTTPRGFIPILGFKKGFAHGSIPDLIKKYKFEDLVKDKIWSSGEIDPLFSNFDAETAVQRLWQEAKGMVENANSVIE